MDVVSLVSLCLKLFLVMYEKLKQTPAEERRKALADFDTAIRQSEKDLKDLRDYSKWLGRRL